MMWRGVWWHYPEISPSNSSLRKQSCGIEKGGSEGLFSVIKSLINAYANWRRESAHPSNVPSVMTLWLVSPNVLYSNKPLRFIQPFQIYFPLVFIPFLQTELDVWAVWLLICTNIIPRHSYTFFLFPDESKLQSWFYHVWNACSQGTEAYSQLHKL